MKNLSEIIKVNRFGLTKVKFTELEQVSRLKYLTIPKRNLIESVELFSFEIPAPILALILVSLPSTLNGLGMKQLIITGEKIIEFSFPSQLNELVLDECKFGIHNIEIQKATLEIIGLCRFVDNDSKVISIVPNGRPLNANLNFLLLNSYNIPIRSIIALPFLTELYLHYCNLQENLGNFFSFLFAFNARLYKGCLNHCKFDQKQFIQYLRDWLIEEKEMTLELMCNISGIYFIVSIPKHNLVLELCMQFKNPSEDGSSYFDMIFPSFTRKSKRICANSSIQFVAQVKTLAALEDFFPAIEKLFILELISFEINRMKIQPIQQDKVTIKFIKIPYQGMYPVFHNLIDKKLQNVSIDGIKYEFKANLSTEFDFEFRPVEIKKDLLFRNGNTLRLLFDEQEEQIEGPEEESFLYINILESLFDENNEHKEAESFLDGNGSDALLNENQNDNQD